MGSCVSFNIGVLDLGKRITLVYNNITCLCVWAGVCSMGRGYRSNVHQTLIPGGRTRHSL